MPTFSTCFGAPFLPLDPSVYAEMLAEKVEKSGANVYLVNTGWNGYSGKRMKLAYTRAMVTAALNGELEKSRVRHRSHLRRASAYRPARACPSELLIPASTWEDKDSLSRRGCKELASQLR